MPASPSNQEEVPKNLTEVSQLYPSPSQDQTKNPSFPVNPVTVGNKDVSVSPRMELNINLLHEAVKKLHLVPAEMDYPVGGRLRHFLGNWKLITQDNFILQIVQGLEIPFLETPMQISCPCPQPNQMNCILIDQEVQMMISKEAVKQVSACPDQFLSPVFLVQKKDGGQRPVINLKRLNQYVEYQHFKLEGIQALESLVKKGDFMVKLDLSDAYFGVPILKSHRKYLRFVWRGKTFEFQALPFG